MTMTDEELKAEFDAVNEYREAMCLEAKFEFKAERKAARKKYNAKLEAVRDECDAKFEAVWDKRNASGNELPAVEAKLMTAEVSIKEIVVECQCQGARVKRTGCPPLEISVCNKGSLDIVIGDRSIIITNKAAKRLLSKLEAMILSNEHQGKDK
jgi:hypothetical protein